MQRRDFLQTTALGLAWFALTGLAKAPPLPRKPNFVIVLCDDLGYGDVGAFGAKLIKTPNLDRMAAEGVCLTDYYAPANICTPSRAGLLTGRYPIRTGLGYEVIQQADDRGLPLTEVTLPKALKADYVSGLFGKWHLGHTGPSWPPTKHGFDTYFGIPYSHDMRPLALYESHTGSDEVVSMPADLPTLQQQFYAKAEAFIEANHDRPFLVELALSTPHLPDIAPPPFKGTSAAGGFGDMVVEIDSLMGRLMAKLKALKIDRDTLVLFTSDNGPWYEGSSGPLRERKGGGAYDGASRVPFIARMPGTLPAGRRVASMASGVDILPTLCAMAKVPLPANVTIDGKDLTPVLLKGAASPHEEIILFDNENVVGIRTQRWKYVDRAYYRNMNLPFGLMNLDELYDLSIDPGENYSVASLHPDVLADMKARFARAKATFLPMKHKDIPPIYKTLRQVLGPLQD